MQLNPARDRLTFTRHHTRRPYPPFIPRGRCIICVYRCLPYNFQCNCFFSNLTFTNWSYCVTFRKVLIMKFGGNVQVANIQNRTDRKCSRIKTVCSTFIIKKHKISFYCTRDLGNHFQACLQCLQNSWKVKILRIEINVKLELIYNILHILSKETSLAGTIWQYKSHPPSQNTVRWCVITSLPLNIYTRLAETRQYVKHFARNHWPKLWLSSVVTLSSKRARIQKPSPAQHWQDAKCSAFPSDDLKAVEVSNVTPCI